MWIAPRPAARGRGGRARDGSGARRLEMTGMRLAATLAAVMVLGAGCKKQGGGDYQGSSTEHMPNDSTGMYGGATSGSNSSAQDPSAGAPAGATQGGAPTPGAGSGVPPVQPP